MHKFILMVLLSVVSCSAMATWVEIARSNALTSYADPATIRKNGNIVKMWIMRDHLNPTGKKGEQYLSTIGQDIYDCKEELSRLITFTAFSENMSRGQVVFRVGANPSGWDPSSPRSIGSSEMKFACGVQ